MITLIYGSSANRKMTEQELIDILRTSRENNEKKNITGMLLYDDGNFLQVLEGEEEDVTSLYKTIQQDPRHHSVFTYVKQPITERLFGDWEMGFIDMEKQAENLPGYSRFLDDPDHSIKLKDATYAFAFLNVFRENIR